MLDTLVKLAAIGTSGICIFAIFWSGWLIHKTADPVKLATIRFFIAMAVLIALVAAASGVLNAVVSRNTIQRLKAEKAAVSTELVAKQDSLWALRRRVAP